MSDVLSGMTFKDLNTHLLQAIGDAGALLIRAGNAEAEIDEHLGNSGHTASSDAHEMNMLDSAKHYSCVSCVFLWLSSSIISTAAAAASPCANLRLASSIRFNSSGACASLSISCANRLPLNSC